MVWTNRITIFNQLAVGLNLLFFTTLAFLKVLRALRIFYSFQGVYSKKKKCYISKQFHRISMLQAARYCTWYKSEHGVVVFADAGVGEGSINPSLEHILTLPSHLGSDSATCSPLQNWCARWSTSIYWYGLNSILVGVTIFKV